ncbi:hypothetical protein NNM86_00670 [Enterococcus faecalis]|uniref:VE27 n=1 Tax=Enterococcus faecalis TaxID=1351 RepID=C4P4K4_ENTFL|nr:hypothetical protein [Enterococcus faecalis]ACQ89887.1 VE27 [Enterococcus faecalis]MDE3927519.1 hypothetical protein [Enterococcus faecalis]MDE3939194.1 hypothetical protein [Enterococcus faecalis]
MLDNQPREIIGGSYLPDEKDAKKMSKAERKKAAEQEIDESKFTLSIYPEAVFEDGEATGDIYIRNEIGNAYPISVEIVDDSTGDIIYESGAIQPGYEVTEGQLNKKLAKGKYKCTANVSIYDPKTNKFKGQTAAEIEIEVEN